MCCSFAEFEKKIFPSKFRLRPEDGLYGSNEPKKCEIRPVVSSIVHFKVFKSYFIYITSRFPVQRTDPPCRARCFGSLKKWKKMVHRVGWYHLKAHISGFQISPKLKSCTFPNSSNLQSNICLQAHYYLHSKGSFWRGFLQLLVAQPGWYKCLDNLQYSLIINVQKHVLNTAQNPPETCL